MLRVLRACSASRHPRQAAPTVAERGRRLHAGGTAGTRLAEDRPRCANRTRTGPRSRNISCMAWVTRSDSMSMMSASRPEPIQPGWVLTVEPGIYIPEEGFAVRLENDIVVQRGRQPRPDGGHPHRSRTKSRNSSAASCGGLDPIFDHGSPRASEAMPQKRAAALGGRSLHYGFARSEIYFLTALRTKPRLESPAPSSMRVMPPSGTVGGIGGGSAVPISAPHSSKLPVVGKFPGGDPSSL